MSAFLFAIMRITDISHLRYGKAGRSGRSVQSADSGRCPVSVKADALINPFTMRDYLCLFSFPELIIIRWAKSYTANIQNTPHCVSRFCRVSLDSGHGVTPSKRLTLKFARPVSSLLLSLWAKWRFFRFGIALFDRWSACRWNLIPSSLLLACASTDKRGDLG